MQEYLEESVKHVEKVKEGVVHYINDTLKAVNPSGSMSTTIKIGKQSIANVVAARPYNKTSTSGILPYVDIELIRSNGSPIYIGLRMAKRKKFFIYRGKKLSRYAIPALDHGIRSLEVAYPNIREDFTGSLLNYYLDNGYSHGTSLSNASGKIQSKMKSEILMGSKRFGGECDYLLAIDKTPFSWKKFSIPTMTSGYVGNKFVISIGNSRLFSKQEVLSGHDIYVSYGDVSDRTLYLGNDKVDKANLPVIIGPRPGRRDMYGGGMLFVFLTAPSKNVFEIKQNKSILRIALKNPKDLISDPQLPQGSSDDHNDIESDDRHNRRFGRRGGRYELPTKIKSNLSYDERSDLMTAIADKFDEGFKNLYRKELKYDQVEYIMKQIEDDYDDLEMQRLIRELPHEIAKELKKKYL